MDMEPEANIESFQDGALLLDDTEGVDTAEGEAELTPKEIARRKAVEKRWIKNDWIFWPLLLLGIGAWWLFMTDSFQSLAQEYEPLYPAMMSNPLEDDGTYLLISLANW